MQTNPKKEGKWVVSNFSTTLLPPPFVFVLSVLENSVNDVAKCYEIVLLEQKMKEAVIGVQKLLVLQQKGVLLF